MEKIANKIIGISLCATIFFIPFSKSGIEIFAHIAIAVWALKKITMHKLKVENYFPEMPLNKPIMTLFVVSFVSMAISVDVALSLEGVFLKLAEYLLLFYVCFDFLTENNQAKRTKFLLSVTIASVLLIFGDAIFQCVTGTDFLRGYAIIGRLRASFLSPNDFAGWLIIVIPLLLAMSVFDYRTRKSSLRFNLPLIALAAAGIGFLGMTFSRGAWLGFLSGFCFVGFFVFVNKTKPIKIFSFFVILFLCASFLLGYLVFDPIKKRLVTLSEGFEKAGSKKYVWQEALNIIEDFPIFGTGPNTYAVVAPHYRLTEETGNYPHNSYLHMAAETGLLGLGSFLWILWRFFYTGIRKVKETGDILLLGIMGGLLAFMGQSFFDTNLYALQLVVLFWIMLGIGMARIQFFQITDIMRKNP